MPSGVRVRHQKIYVMDAGDARKVGIAVDEHSRAKLIAKEIEAQVRVCWLSDASNDAWMVEALAHKILWADGYHIDGEWFSASVEKCVEAVRCAAAGNSEISKTVVGSAKKGFRWAGAKSTINLLVDDETKQAIDEIRSMRRPVPTISEAVRQAILNERDTLKRKTEREKR